MSAVLGVSSGFHDAAAALIVDGVVVAAAEEERFSRVKHDPSLPEAAIAYCLEAGGIGPGGLDGVAYYEKPLTTYERIIATSAEAGPRSFKTFGRAVASWTSSKLWIGYQIEAFLAKLGHRKVPLLFAEHHQSHAAAAFFPSPFERAAILTFDGAGEWSTSSIAWGIGDRIEMRRQLRFPDSIGLFYSAMTSFCGFEVNDGEYKLMGLAPFGKPTYVDALKEHVIDVHDDGSIRLDQRWFDYLHGARMTRPRLAEVLGGPAHDPAQPLGEREADIARSVQVVLEEIVLKAGRHAWDLTREPNACLAGGVALNCVANQRLLEEGPFEEIWIQPAAGDSGSSVGAALWAWHQIWGRSRPVPEGRDGMSGGALGPSYSHDEVRDWLTGAGIPFEEHSAPGALAGAVARSLASGRTVGWFQGRMEFGPRALGHRSILADPRDPGMVSKINRSVKGREGFRPFAPAVLREHARDWFDVSGERAYMTVTAQVAAAQRVEVGDEAEGFAARLSQVRSTIPACTHVDGSARVQTVDRRDHPAFHELIEAFHGETGCPVVLNTSFNRAGEPIVRTPAEAVRCFLEAGLDVLAIEGCVLEREQVAAVHPG